MDTILNIDPDVHYTMDFYETLNIIPTLKNLRHVFKLYLFINKLENTRVHHPERASSLINLYPCLNMLE